MATPMWVAGRVFASRIEHVLRYNPLISGGRVYDRKTCHESHEFHELCLSLFRVIREIRGKETALERCCRRGNRFGLKHGALI